MSDVVYVLCDFIVLYSMHVFCKKLFDGRNRVKQFLSLAVFLLIDCLFYFMVSVPYLFAVVSFILYVGVSLGYSRRISYKNFLTAFLFLIFGICSELVASHLVVFVMRLLGQEQQENMLVAALIVARLLFFVVILLATGLVRYQNKAEKLPAAARLVVFLPILSIVLILYVFSLAQFNHKSLMGAGSLGAVVSVGAIVVMNIAVFWLFDRQFRIYQVEKEANDLRMTIQVQQEHYNGEMDKREALRKMRHDYKNFLLALRADMENGHVEEALKAIAGELSSDGMNTLPQSGQYAIDAIVGNKAAVATKRNMRVIPEYHLMGNPTASSEDICVLIGNGLDNAMEYLECHPDCDQHISIKIVYDKGVLNISIRNQVQDTIEIKDGREIKSTKQTDGHGLGLKSMDYIAQKYGGRLILSCTQGIFSCGVILYC